MSLVMASPGSRGRRQILAEPGRVSAIERAGTSDLLSKPEKSPEPAIATKRKKEKRRSAYKNWVRGWTCSKGRDKLSFEESD